jgi:hypothetical protein
MDVANTFLLPLNVTTKILAFAKLGFSTLTVSTQWIFRLKCSGLKLQLIHDRWTYSENTVRKNILQDTSVSVDYSHCIGLVAHTGFGPVISKLDNICMWMNETYSSPVNLHSSIPLFPPSMLQESTCTCY